MRYHRSTRAGSRRADEIFTGSVYSGFYVFGANMNHGRGTASLRLSGIHGGRTWRVGGIGRDFRKNQQHIKCEQSVIHLPDSLFEHLGDELSDAAGS